MECAHLGQEPLHCSGPEGEGAATGVWVTHTRTHTCTCMHTQHTCTRTHTHMHTHIQHKCTHMHAHTHTHVHTLHTTHTTHTHTHTHTQHTCKHTHTHTQHTLNTHTLICPMYMPSTTIVHSPVQHQLRDMQASAALVKEAVSKVFGEVHHLQCVVSGPLQLAPNLQPSCTPPPLPPLASTTIAPAVALCMKYASINELCVDRVCC